MKNFLALLGLSMFAVAAGPAAATERTTFPPDGTGSQVVSVTQGTGAMLLRGVNPATGETFNVRVSPFGHVTGEFAGKKVDYKLNDRRVAEVQVGR
jgi:hypothetical protein